MTEASGVPPSDRTTVTMRWAHGWTAPTKPAPRASRTAILQLSTRPRGRSLNRVSATNRASVRVSFMSAQTVARGCGERWTRRDRGRRLARAGGIMERRDHHDWASETYVDEWVRRQQAEDPIRAE